jgi:hypothetical protein
MVLNITGLAAVGSMQPEVWDTDARNIFISYLFWVFFHFVSCFVLVSSRFRHLKNL